MSEPDWQELLRERAKVVGITFDEAQVPLLAKSFGSTLSALEEYRSQLRSWDEPPTTFDARITRQP